MMDICVDYFEYQKTIHFLSVSPPPLVGEFTRVRAGGIYQLARRKETEGNVKQITNRTSVGRGGESVGNAIVTLPSPPHLGTQF